MAVSMLNASDCAQLSSIPGIERDFADAVIRYRDHNTTLTGRAGEFAFFDEVWNVPGISRTKFEILKRHFKAFDPPGKPGKPAEPVQRTTSFICKGQGVRKSKPGLNDDWDAQRQSNNSSYRLSSNTIEIPVNNDQQFVETPSLRELAAQAPPSSPQPTSATKQPSFVLESSASGNNINVTCTIDKQQLLNGLGEEEKQKEGFATSDYGTGVPTVASLPDTEREAAELSQENLLRFDRMQRASADDKLVVIDAWVSTVNEARASVTRKQAKVQVDEGDANAIIRVRVTKNPAGEEKQNIDSVSVAEGPALKPAAPAITPRKEKLSAFLRGVTPVQYQYQAEPDAAKPKQAPPSPTIRGGRPAGAPRGKNALYVGSTAAARHQSAAAQPATRHRLSFHRAPGAKQSRDSSRLHSASSPDTSQRRAASRELVRLPAAAAHTSSGGTRKTQPLIARVWQETQQEDGGGGGGAGLLRKPLSKARRTPSPSKQRHSGIALKTKLH